MKILAIETSCDETAIAILEAIGGLKQPRFRVLANIVSSQVKVHKKYGGVVPSLAKREHEKNLTLVLKMALKEAGLLKEIKPQTLNLKSKILNLKEIFSREPELQKNLLNFLKKYEFPKFDCITVTIGPGLEPALWTGINFARALSFLFDILLAPVDHMKAHFYINWLNPEFAQNPFPTLILLISGGHTQLVLAEGHSNFKILGETRDDAVGEAFDKVAKMLNLGYPGGPLIERLALNGDPKVFNFPRPMVNQKNYDFSFSGLKTAVLYKLNKIKNLKSKILNLKSNVSASFQQAVVEVLVFKTVKAGKEFRGRIKNIVGGGGSIANRQIRAALETAIKKELPKVKVYFPPIVLATDNALMIAIAGYFNYLKSETIGWQTARALPNLRVDEKVKYLQS